MVTRGLMACWHLTYDNSLWVVIHPHKLIHSSPMMAGHLRVKRCNLAQFWGHFCEAKLHLFAYKRGADFSAQNKGETQLNAAQKSAPKPSTKPPKPVPKVHQKPSENLCKTKPFVQPDLCVLLGLIFVQFFLHFQPKTVGYLGCETKKKFWVLRENSRRVFGSNFGY